jgi:hypothetical protein
MATRRDAGVDPGCADIHIDYKHTSIILRTPGAGGLPCGGIFTGGRYRNIHIIIYTHTHAQAPAAAYP